MPTRDAFATAEGYYATLYHELSHWSGASHRLRRDLGGTFGATSYAREELVAELGAAFLAARVGIGHISQAASYLQSWLNVLKNDRRFLFVAAKLAKEAATFIYPEDGANPDNTFES